MIFIRILLFFAGVALVARILLSALLTFVLPRAVTDQITRFVFYRIRELFTVLSLRAKTYAEQDRIWALFAPVSLFVLPLVWIVLVIFGFAAMFWAVGVPSWEAAISISGSSLLTLGFAAPATMQQTVMAFFEAGIGLALVAVLIAYLPTIYTNWSHREQLVTMLETRAGTPPMPVELFTRYLRIGRLDKLNELWLQWEVWFAEVEESHTSLAALPLFRSAHPDRSWVVAAGCVLDSAALAVSTLDIPYDAQAAIVVRSGALAFRRLATLFRLPFNPDPRYPIAPIAVTREEYDAVCAQLESAGIPLVADREQAWLAFAGWRVNYDDVVRGLAGLTLAPPAPWSSDRATKFPHTWG